MASNIRTTVEIAPDVYEQDFIEGDTELF